MQRVHSWYKVNMYNTNEWGHCGQFSCCCQSSQDICGWEGLEAFILADPMHAQLINKVVDSTLW